jgi:hypothetical protein
MRSGSVSQASCRKLHFQSPHEKQKHPGFRNVCLKPQKGLALQAPNGVATNVGKSKKHREEEIASVRFVWRLPVRKGRVPSNQRPKKQEKNKEKQGNNKNCLFAGPGGTASGSACASCAGGLSQCAACIAHRQP